MKAKQIIERVEQAVNVLKQGGLVVVTDDEQREAEGDLIGLAEFVTPTSVNKMVTKARGLLCVPLAPQVAQRLGLRPMSANSTDAFHTAFTVSVDAKKTATGISAFDRATTIKKISRSSSSTNRFLPARPHFPIDSQRTWCFGTRRTY